MTDRIFFAVMLTGLVIIAAVLLFGCASVWWRDSSVVEGRKCCWTGSQWGEPTGCLVYADDQGRCPEQAP